MKFNIFFDFYSIFIFSLFVHGEVVECLATTLEDPGALFTKHLEISFILKNKLK